MSRFKEGWFVTDGAAIWATGNEYLHSGSQNGRAEVVEFSASHGAFITYEWPQDFNKAQPKDVAVSITRIRCWTERRLAALEDQKSHIARELSKWEEKVP